MTQEKYTVAEGIIFRPQPGTKKCTLNTKYKDHLIDRNSNNYLVIFTKKVMVS